MFQFEREFTQQAPAERDGRKGAGCEAWPGGRDVDEVLAKANIVPKATQAKDKVVAYDRTEGRSPRPSCTKISSSPAGPGAGEGRCERLLHEKGLERQNKERGNEDEDPIYPVYVMTPRPKRRTRGRGEGIGSKGLHPPDAFDGRSGIQGSDSVLQKIQTPSERMVS